MRLVEIVKAIEESSVLAGLVGFAFSAMIAWSFRKEIAHAEKRRAAKIAERAAAKAAKKNEQREEALAGAGAARS